MGSESRVCFRAHTVKTCVFMAFGSGTQNKRFCGIHAVKGSKLWLRPVFLLYKGIASQFCAGAAHLGDLGLRRVHDTADHPRDGRLRHQRLPVQPPFVFGNTDRKHGRAGFLTSKSHSMRLGVAFVRGARGHFHVPFAHEYGKGL